MIKKNIKHSFIEKYLNFFWLKAKKAPYLLVGGHFSSFPQYRGGNSMTYCVALGLLQKGERWST